VCAPNWRQIFCVLCCVHPALIQNIISVFLHNRVAAEPQLLSCVLHYCWPAGREGPLMTRFATSGCLHPATEAGPAAQQPPANRSDAVAADSCLRHLHLFKQQVSKSSGFVANLCSCERLAVTHIWA
jgi:hypothetical protein